MSHKWRTLELGDLADRDFKKRLGRLKKDYQKNIRPEIRKRAYGMSKGEAKREKHLKTLRRLRKKQNRIRKAMRRNA